MELSKYQISTNEDQTVFKFTSAGPLLAQVCNLCPLFMLEARVTI